MTRIDIRDVAELYRVPEWMITDVAKPRWWRHPFIRLSRWWWTVR